MDIAGYELSAQLHASANSVVFRARRVRDGLPVVIKALPGEYPAAERVARLRAEFEMTRRLGGSGVIGAYDLVESSRTIAMVIEDIGAESLALQSSGRPMDLAAALALALDLIAAVEHVHRRGVVHKDINPTNVIHHPGRGEMRLIDFGLATRIGHENVDFRRLEGTLGYLAPEQTGRMNRGVDYRSDFYAIGATLYELLTGRPPFQSDDPLELVHSHLAREPVPVHQVNTAVPRQLSAIVSRLLAKMPEARYQSARGLAADLSRCLAGLRAGGQIADFPPGADDVPERFQIPERLYGREAEVERLARAFAAVAEGGRKVVLLSGYSGIGKSAVAAELHRPIVARRGLFATGKFDQYTRDIPLSALTQALRQLLRGLLAEDEEALSRWRNGLAQALGRNAGVLAPVLPELALLVGEAPPLPELPPHEVQNRFQLTMQDLLRAVAAPAHPLVLVLDDLQWADGPSLRMLERLATDPAIGHLLLVGAYRDHEVDEGHALMTSLRILERDGADLDRIALAPLGPGDVARFVADALRIPAGEAAPLAELAHKKTAGNPFFLGQLLRALHERGHIAFVPERGAFACDLAAVTASDITDNVIDLLTGKLRRLPEATRRVLALAACIGGRFDLATLAVVAGEARVAAADHLWPALLDELVAPIGSDYKFVDESPSYNPSYRFVHDRVQQAAGALIPEGRLAETHLAIGRLMLAASPDAERDEDLFAIFKHLHEGASLIHDRAERDRVAEIGLAAGRRAMAAAAYAPAARFLTAGIALLGEDGWRRRYRLALDLHNAAAQATQLSGDVEAMDRLAGEVIEHARALPDRFDAYEARMFARLGPSGRLREGVEICLEVLEQLGVRFPAPGKVRRRHVVASLLATKLALAGKRPEDLERLPAMTSPTEAAALRFLMLAGAAVYIARPELVPLVALKMVRLSSRALGAESYYAFACYGLMLTGYLGDIPLGYRYGQLSKRLAQRAGLERHRCTADQMRALFIDHWKVPLVETLPVLEGALRSGLETGNFEYAFNAAAVHTSHSLLSGRRLDVVAADGAAFASTARRMGLGDRVYVIAMTLQAVENLRGGAADPLVLTGAIADEERVRAAGEAGGEPYHRCTFFILKTMLAVYFGDAAAARRHAAAAAEFEAGVGGTVFVSALAFFRALAALMGPGPANREAIAGARRALEQLRGWAEHAPRNQRHRALLLEAEIARARGERGAATDAYDRAVAAAREAQHVGEEALACERAGRFHRALGREAIAREYLREARFAYERWDARGKVRRLDAEMPELTAAGRAPRAGGDPTTASPSLGADPSALDLRTVMKASQALSGEIVLADLLRAIMRIVIENAGAQRGVLLLGEQGRLAVSAEGAVDGEARAILDGKPADPAEIAASVINYVARAGETVVLADAAGDGSFGNDPYVRARGAKSILAMPVKHQGKSAGVLYLENNLTTGAFTPDRVEVLGLLSTQAAISLENGTLYRTLEERVAERTRELYDKTEELSAALAQLQRMQEQIVVQEKMASFGALTAGVAHEIRNPLNFICNFSTLSLDTVRELREALGAPGGDAGDLLADLEENAEKIAEYGARANGIVTSLLAHAKPSSTSWETADLHALIEGALRVVAHGAAPPERSVTVERSFDAPAPSVRVVVPDISRALRNLLSNAFYAAADRRRAEGSDFAPKVRLTTRRVPGGVEVRVWDNGHGIPAAIADKIYKPFFTTKPAGQGVGLGLSMAHDIVVKQHGGSLRLETEEGQFAEFVVTLPT